MATLGNVPAEAYTNTVKDSFSGNGSATAFTMSLPTVTNDVRVVVENVIQDPTVAYSVSGTTLTFTSAPPSGTNNIYVVHLGPAVMTTVPPAEIADATTFASSLTVQGAFTSKGIDDNADAVALTIDSSENVLIGKTSAGSATGVELAASGQVAVTRDGAVPAFFRRNTSDGSLIDFNKDGTAVGSIGNDGVNLTINSSSTGVLQTVGTSRYYWDDAQIYPANTNSKNLGHPSYQFKDAYLSGGIHLGGTVAANKLDDYEEGTFTPTVTVGTLGDANGIYTKIGNTVIAYMYMGAFSNRSSGSILTINNLPFTSANVVANGAGGSIFSRHCNKLPNATYVSNNTTNVEMYESATGNYDTVKHADLNDVSAYFFIQVIYKTS
jgi:hypothetical protein